MNRKTAIIMIMGRTVPAVVMTMMTMATTAIMRGNAATATCMTMTIIIMKDAATTTCMSWGMETPAAYTAEEIGRLLAELEHEDEYGLVLRAKGMVSAGNGTWVYFDYVPGECDIREGRPDVTGRICVIGSKLAEDNLKKLFSR